MLNFPFFLSCRRFANVFRGWACLPSHVHADHTGVLLFEVLTPSSSLKTIENVGLLFFKREERVVVLVTCMNAVVVLNFLTFYWVDHQSQYLGWLRICKNRNYSDSVVCTSPSDCM